MKVTSVDFENDTRIGRYIDEFGEETEGGRVFQISVDSIRFDVFLEFQNDVLLVLDKAQKCASDLRATFGRRVASFGGD